MEQATSPITSGYNNRQCWPGISRLVNNRREISAIHLVSANFPKNHFIFLGPILPCKWRDLDMKDIMFLSIFAYILVLPITILEATAARLPNSVEKKIIFHGDQAREIGLLLGFEDTRTSEKLYRLGKQDVWAAFLKEHPYPYDSKEVSIEDRFNRVRYLPKPEPCIILEGNWLDTHTGSSPTLPRYIFSSPPISEDSSDKEWGQLLKHLLSKVQKPTTQNGYWETVFEKRISDKKEQLFSITIYKPKDRESAAGSWGYIIIIGAKDNKLK